MVWGFNSFFVISRWFDVKYSLPLNPCPWRFAVMSFYVYMVLSNNNFVRVYIYEYTDLGRKNGRQQTDGYNSRGKQAFQ